MSQTVIRVENLYKEYKLGVINHGTLTHDLQSWWAKMRGKEDPNSLISAHHNADVEKDSFLALKDVSFEVRQGDRIGIIGKNGAGKSTLLKILSKITSPTSGQINIKGRVGALLEVGTGFHPELTGRENIYLNGAILGMNKKEIDHKLDEIIDFAGIEKHIDTPVKRYSSGMNVRLGFAIAAHLEPEILIVDEVLAVGDADFQKKAIGKMEDVSKGEGRTILFVSHNMAAVKGLCDSCLLLESGKIIIQGMTDKVISEYNNINFVNLTNRDFTEKSLLKKGQTLQLLAIDILNSDGENMNDIPCGEEVSFTIKFLVIPEAIKNLRFGIAFYDSANGNCVTELNSYYNREENIICKEGLNRCTFTIKKMPISPGKYNLNLIATSGNDILDWLKDACQVDIRDGLFYNTSRMPLPGNYPVFFTEFDVEVKELKPS